MSGEQFAAEFERLAGSALPARHPNRLEDRVGRRDSLFPVLAGWAFDRPEAVPPMREWARGWAEGPGGCAAWELYGYLSYLAEDWREAARAFMASLEREPDNLDAWMDLAFSLRHLGVGLGDSILWDHDEFLRTCREDPPARLSLFTLQAMEDRIRREGRSYCQVYGEWIEPYREAVR